MTDTSRKVEKIVNIENEPVPEKNVKCSYRDRILYKMTWWNKASYTLCSYVYGEINYL